MDNKTDEFLDKIIHFSNQEFSKKAINRAKLAFLDYLAVTVAGGKFLGDKIDNYIKINHLEKGSFKLIGKDYSLNLNDTVFLNGLMAHALDFDDGTNAGIIHLGSPIFSLLISLAKKYNIEDMDKFYKSIIIGYEASFTLANSIQPTHKYKGFHATGTLGILGAIVAGSYLLDFTKEQLKCAFSIGSISSTGMLKAIDDNSELKPYNVAKAALLSLVSIQMSMCEFKVPVDSLGGERGLFSIMYGSEEVIYPEMKLDGNCAIEKAYIKPYAACRYCHPSIDGAIYLSSKYNLNNTNIEEIIVETYATAVKGHDHISIKNASSAKMSIPYSVAIGINYKKAGVLEFTDKKLDSTDIRELAQKVHVKVDNNLSSLFPKLSGANVCIIDNSGRKYTKKIKYAKGEPENPLSQLEFFDRYLDLYNYAGINDECSKKIYDIILNEESKFSDIYYYI